MQDKLVKETKKPVKIVSRREFIKDAGLIVGGAALGSVALVNACGGTTTQTVTETTTKTTTQQSVLTSKVAETQTVPVTTTITQPLTTTVTAPGTTVTTTAPGTTVTTIVPKSGYVSWDSEQCACCSRCLMACSAYKQGAVAMQLSAVRWVDNDEFSGFRFRQPLFCQQCSQPECYFACPLKDQALCIDAKTGARYIDKDKCTGCGICIQACPFEVPRISLDEESMKAIKCDLCKDRAEGPVCMEICTRQALTLVGKETRL